MQRPGRQARYGQDVKGAPVDAPRPAAAAYRVRSCSGQDVKGAPVDAPGSSMAKMLSAIAPIAAERADEPVSAHSDLAFGSIKAHPVSRVRAVTFSLQWSVRFPQGVGYEHSTHRFRSAQALRANAAGHPIGADRFRFASSLRTNGAGSPVQCGDGSRSRAGGTCLSSSRAAGRHPTGAGSRACGEPLGASTAAGRRQPKRWILRLAEEVVRRLNRRREASALQGRQHCRRTWNRRWAGRTGAGCVANCVIEAVRFPDRRRTRLESALVGAGPASPLFTPMRRITPRPEPPGMAGSLAASASRLSSLENL